jgi:hypothetical protein
VRRVLAAAVAGDGVGTFPDARISDSVAAVAEASTEAGRRARKDGRRKRKSRNGGGGDAANHSWIVYYRMGLKGCRGSDAVSG